MPATTPWRCAWRGYRIRSCTWVPSPTGVAGAGPTPPAPDPAARRFEARLGQLGQWLARIEARVGFMPPLDPLALAETPTQPDGSAAGQRREVNQAAADVAQRDTPLVDLADRELHPVDDAEQFRLELGHLLGVLGAAIAFARAGELALDLGHSVAICPQLLEQRLDFAQQLVRLVEPEIPRHRGILPLACV